MSFIPQNLKDAAFIIDGSGYIFRAFHAVPLLSNKEGLYTNALYGFQKMILRLFSEFKPHLCAIAFDVARETFRTILSPEYKAHRAECPSELVPQLPYFRELSIAMGLPVFEAPDFEADDVIGTLAKQLSAEGLTVVLVTGDKDFMQLVSDQIILFDSMKSTFSSFDQVYKRFGVTPNLVPDVLALSGDTSDNIIGLQGVGEKTAAQLVQLYGPVENIIDRGNDILQNKVIRNRVKIGGQINEKKEALLLNKKLTTIDCTVPLSLRSDVVSSTENAWKTTVERIEPNNESLTRLSKLLDFPNLVKDCDVLKLSPLASKDIASQEKSFEPRCVVRKETDQFFELLSLQTSFAIDLETTALDPHTATIVGASFCWDSLETWYVPCGHTVDGVIRDDQISEMELVAKLKPYLESAAIKKCGQNCKFDISVLICKGISPQGFTFDSMIAAYLLYPDRRGYGLDALAQLYLEYKAQSYKEVTVGLTNFSEVSLEAASFYAGEDALLAWRLKEVLYPKLEALGLLELLADIEMPLVTILASMELNGICLDKELFSVLTEECKAALKITEESLSKELHEPINLNSPKQIATLLFDVLNLPTKRIKKTKSGYSTDASSLEILAPFHPIPRLLLDYRINQKLLTTYLEPLPLQVSPHTHRLHTRFNQTMTGTGRLSSSDPNLQNIPISTPFGRRIREGFKASSGMTLVCADYSQIELRILAHLSKDKVLSSAFQHNVDIHTQTARQILNIPEGRDVSYSERRIGKTINFGIVYGMGAFRLGAELGVSNETAQNYIKAYFDRFEGVRSYFAHLQKIALTAGETRTLFNRRRVLSDLSGDSPEGPSRDKSFLARVATNAPVQGTAADIMKKAMIGVFQQCKRARLLLQIHDELVVECKQHEASEVCEEVKSIMESVVEFSVPLKVEARHNLHWGYSV